MTPLKEKEKIRISKDLDENIKVLDPVIGIKKNFDVLTRELTIGGKRAVLLFIDGLTNDMILTIILQTLVGLEREEMTPEALQKLLRKHLGYTEVERVDGPPCNMKMGSEITPDRYF